MAKSLLLLLALIPFVCFWKINFKLNGNGCLETQDGKDYVVVNCDGKTAHDFPIGVLPLRIRLMYACVVP